MPNDNSSIHVITYKQLKTVRKADSGARLLHALHVGSYLPFSRFNSSLASSYTTMKKTNGYTLSPATAPKCGAIKRVSFTSNYLTLICQSESVFLFQRVSQSEAITCQSNASSTAFKNTRVNGCCAGDMITPPIPRN